MGAAKKVTPETVAHSDILTTAHGIIYGDREQTYGHPAANLEMIAEYWSTHLARRTGMRFDLTPADVCGMMILMKQARLANSPDHLDSLVDIAGYAALQERCMNSEGL